MPIVSFVHVLGVALWIGGWVAAVAVASAAAEEPGPLRVGAYRMLSRAFTMVVGLGALLTVGTGVLLLMRLSTDGMGLVFQEPRLWVMAVAGLVGGLMVIFVVLPSAVRTGALATSSDEGSAAPAFEVYRRRLTVVSAIAGALAVLALFAWYAF